MNHTKGELLKMVGKNITCKIGSHESIVDAKLQFVDNKFYICQNIA